MFNRKLLILTIIWISFIAADQMADYERREASLLPAMARIKQIREEIIARSQNDQQAINRMARNREMIDLLSNPELRVITEQEALYDYFPDMHVDLPDLIRALRESEQVLNDDQNEQEQFQPVEQVLTPQLPVVMIEQHPEQEGLVLPSFNDLESGMPSLNEVPAQMLLPEPQAQPESFQVFLQRLEAQHPNASNISRSSSQPDNIFGMILENFAAFPDYIQQGSSSVPASTASGQKRSREDSDSESEGGSPRKRARTSPTDFAGRSLPAQPKDDSDDEGGHLYVY